MQIRLLLGPAGSGKTFRCLSEIRDALAAGPEGRPLVFLAPKQATFQLERQLLSDGLAGYSRLQILSFPRLARLIFDYYQKPFPRLLSAEGRVMVLRALLSRVRLNIYSASARRLGFAEEASEQLREFQQHGLSPEDLRRLASETRDGPVPAKLRDLAVLYEAFQGWLQANELQDEEALLPLAADLLETNSGGLQLGGLWFDGFAQLTPQERRLLCATVGESERAILAFCLEHSPAVEAEASPWHLVSQTFKRCRAELAMRYGEEAIQVENLGRGEGRFPRDSALSHLERCWARAEAFPEHTGAVRILECPDAETEVVACAREIVRAVRAGRRYRELAVLLRSFSNDYPYLIRRIFARYEIPCFLDHREGVAHHPLAELTRGAVRMLVFNWRHVDCFSVFKTGLMRLRTDYLYELENAALENGWEGDDWLQGFPVRGRGSNDPAKVRESQARYNAERERLAAPFVKLSERLGDRPTGAAFAAAIKALWRELEVEEKLEEWSRGEAIHETVWDQLNDWLGNLELAFAHQGMPLREWLPIIEAGLNGLTVGVIPPVLDQVLVGTVDRSRNPDLKSLFVLGVNEGAFPAVPPHKPLLTDLDREALLDTGRELANVPSTQISQEQFYGYIACTRARESLVLSYARADGQGRALNPSRFIGQIQRLFPHVVVEAAHKPGTLAEVEHASEINAISLGETLPDNLRTRVRSLPAADPTEDLDPALAERLYGRELTVAVSSLERFASCKFRFFLEQGLRVRERNEFDLDIREQGSFQHEVLARYHLEVTKRQKRWRDLTASEARQLIGEIADELMTTFHGGLLLQNEQNRFTGQNYKRTLQDFIAMVTEWFKSNSFDPVEVELPFGGEGLSPWTLPLSGDRSLKLVGRVDRVDVFRQPDGTGLCVIIDYKSGGLKPDKTLITHGVQQQLLAYLLAVTSAPEAGQKLGVTQLVPAGCFYVPLAAKTDRKATRDEVLSGIKDRRRAAYQHLGLFDVNHLKLLESEKSWQFDYRLTNDGVPHARSFSALPHETFSGLLNLLRENAGKFGESIYAGEIDIHPYRKGSEKACRYCKHQAICRFTPWEQDYRVLSGDAGTNE